MPAIPDPAALELSPADMKALGYRVIDMLVDHHVNLRDSHPAGTISRATAEALLREPAPAGPSAPEAVLEELDQKIIRNTLFPTHHRHFGWIPGPSNFVGAMGDAIASGFNFCPGLWLEASAASQVELVAVDWLRELCGMPEGAGGLFVSGGSVANLTALATARRVKLGFEFADAVAYCSDQTHRSNAKNLRILGFAPDQLGEVPTDARMRLDVAALSRAIATDRAAGRRPFCVIANAGTTNTGAVDPLDALADLCAAEGLWLHVDGAYGAAAMLTEKGRAAMSGIGRVDSLAIDPHKWLFQPYELGCALVRDVRWLPPTFGEQPEYLQDTHTDDDPLGEINFCDYGVQLSRGFRALKLWMSIKVFGVDAFRAAIDRGISNAERAEEMLREAGSFDIVTPAQLGIVTFRYTRDGADVAELDRINLAIIDGLIADGYAFLTSTRIDGRVVLRVCTINPRTAEADLQGTVDLVARLGAGA